MEKSSSIPLGYMPWLQVGFSHALKDDDRAGYVGVRRRKRLLRMVRRPDPLTLTT